MCTIAPPPIVSTQPGPSLESKLAPESEPGFVPFDDAAQAVAPITHPNPGGIAATTPEELDLGMGGYVPLVSLDMEHKLLARFWDWQHLHMPFIAPVPFLAAYALYAQVAHPGELGPPTPPPFANPPAGSGTMSVPSPESVYATPELAQFISPLLLDAMFVIGALFHGDAEMSDQFYKRAESRVIGEAANPRLATVQGVMLMGVTEFGHARASAAWTLNGVLIALCVRLGMHIDATPLVRGGNMSKLLFETRNFVFWTAYVGDRYSAIYLGIHPLMDRRLISTPHHSSLAAANVVKPVHLELDALEARPSSIPAGKPTTSDADATWWSPTTLGLGDVAVQAGWEAMRDLARIMDILFEEIYSFDAPKRSAQEDLELVARNNLTIQRFHDLPTWLRSTDNIRGKHSGIVYLHLYIHVVSILICRPFLSPRPLSEDAIRSDATTDISQPTHSSRIIRRYRTLAFRIARASALQITSLIRHIPPSSPCISDSYCIYTACTILLLVPGDTAAMSGVRAGLACLESLYETGYWSGSMKDGRDRILALARRWGVDIGQAKRVLGPAVRQREGGGGTGTGRPSTVESDGVESNDARPGDMGGGAMIVLGRSNGTRSMSESGSEVGGGTTQPSASAAMYGKEAKTGTTYTQGNSHWTQQYGDGPLAQMYAGQECPESVAPAPNDIYAASLSQENNISFASETRYTTVPHDYGASSGLVYTESTDRPSYAHQQQPHTSAQPIPPQSHRHGSIWSSLIGHEPQVQHREWLVSAPQQQIYHRQPQYQQKQTQYQPRTHYQLQGSKTHPPTPHHVHIHEPTPSTSLPYIAYNIPHAEPQRDSRLSHTHWHQVLPSTDPNFPSPPDAAACSDLAECFSDMIQTAQEEPAFLRTMEDPYIGVAVDWSSDVGCGFPAATLAVYMGLGGTSSGTGMGPVGAGAAADVNLSAGTPGIYARGNEAGQSYGQGHPAYGYDGVGYVD